MTELTGFAKSIAREVTTECETYTNYATATVAKVLEQDQTNIWKIKDLLEDSLDQVEHEEILTLPYIYADKLRGFIEDWYVPDESEANEIVQPACEVFLGLVNWDQISVKLICDYETENELELLSKEERDLF